MAVSLKQSILNVFRRGEKPQLHLRGIPFGALEGLTLTTDQALSVSTVWACINAIAQPLAGCHWYVYKPLGPHKKELLYEDPLTWLLNTRPNPEMTAFAFREALLLQAIPFGNAYAEIVPDRAGRPVQLWPLLSDRVFPERDPETYELRFKVYDAEGSVQYLPQSRVFHLHGPSQNGLIGENIIGRAARTISLAAAQERFATTFFGRGATLSGFLKTKGKISELQQKTLTEDFREKHSGMKGANQIIALEEGVDFEPSGIDPQKAQLIEGRQFGVEEVARMFGVPLHKIGHLERATFSNIEQQDIQFVRDTLTPWAHRLEQEADAKLVGPRAPRMTAIDLRPITQGDGASRAAYYTSGIQNGWITPNEARAQEGLDNIGPDGDVLLVNGTLRPLEQALAEPEPAPVAPAAEQPPADDALSADAKTPDLARQGLVFMLRGALERHQRRLQSRGDTIQGSRQKLNQELAPMLDYAAQVLGHALTEPDVARMAEHVEAGTQTIDAVQLALAA